MPLPVGVADLTIQADFSGTPFGNGLPVWTDITAYLMTSPQEDGSSEVDLSWGRQDWFDDVTASQFSFTLRNIDGRFTPGRAKLADGTTTNPLYPHVRYGVRVQVIESVAGVPVHMADGYVTDWTAVPRNGTYFTTLVNCTDIYSRMGQTMPLRGWLTEEMLLDGPSALFTLQEAEGAISFGDLTGNCAPATIVNTKYGPGVVDAGQDPGIGLVNQTVVTIDNPTYSTFTGGPTAGSYLAVVSPDLSGVTSYSYEMWVQTLTTPPGSNGTIFGLPIAGTSPSVDVSITLGPSGQLEVLSLNWSGLSPVPGFVDGNVHQVVVTISGATLSLYVDGALTGTTTGTGAAGPTPSDVRYGMSLGTQAGAPFSGGLAFLAFYPTALNAGRILNHFNAGNNGFASVALRTDGQIGKLLFYRNHTGSNLDTGLGFMGQQDINGETMADALLDCAHVEGGVLYADGQGRITLRSRSNNFNPIPALTLDASLGMVDVPSQPRDDVQNVATQITVSRAGGADQTVTSTAGEAQNGLITQPINAPIDTDQHALDLANWALAVGSQDQLGFPSLTIDLYAILAQGMTSIALQVLQLRPLDVVTLINLSGVMPAATMTVQVQGGTYSRTSESFSISLTCTPTPLPVVTSDGTVNGISVAADTSDSATFVASY